WEGLFMRRIVVAAAFALAVTTTALAQSSAFVFTAIPDQDETRLVEKFTRVAQYLETKIGIPVKYVSVKSYPAAVTALDNCQVQLAWVGGFTRVQARPAVQGTET